MNVRAGPLLLAIAIVAGCATPAPATTPPSSVPPSQPSGGSPLTPRTPDPAFSQSPTGCPPTVDVTGPWLSDRLIDVTVTERPFSDLVTFVFGPPAVPGARSTVTVRPTTGPFSRGGSGEPVFVDGSSFIEARIEGLVIHDEAGTPTFQGARDQHANLSQVKHVVAIDESEGVMIWIVGTDFGCMELQTDPASLTITLGWSHAVP